MPDEMDPTIRLPGVDDTIDLLLQSDVVDLPPDDTVRQERIQRAVADDDSFRFAIARRMVLEEQAIAQLEHEQHSVWGRYQEAIQPHARRLQFYEDTLIEMARQWRRAGRGNVMPVPGIGEWRTRAAGARWEVDNAAVMAALEGDDRQMFVDPGEPKPPVPKLRGDLYRAHLLKVLADSTAGRGRMTDEERDAIAAQVAAAYPGVEWEPRRIEVKMHPEGGPDDGE